MGLPEGPPDLRRVLLFAEATFRRGAPVVGKDPDGWHMRPGITITGQPGIFAFQKLPAHLGCLLAGVAGGHARTDPRPTSRRLPSRLSMNSQDFAPDGLTWRESALPPSECRPGPESVATDRAVRLFPAVAIDSNRHSTRKHGLPRTRGKTQEKGWAHQTGKMGKFLRRRTPRNRDLAEKEGFEPSIRFPVYTRSRRAP